MHLVEGIVSNGAGCRWVLWRRKRYFWILRVFLVMMSLSRKYLFLATLKGHRDPPPSPITVKPIFLRFPTPK